MEGLEGHSLQRRAAIDENNDLQIDTTQVRRRAVDQDDHDGRNEQRLKALLQLEGGQPMTPHSVADDRHGNSQMLNKSVKSGKQLASSSKARKEAKKLQKYDSNSIDEEEFQDYFSNPQKRKEFDRQRLQQQVKEIQSIAGFSLGQFSGKSMKTIKDAFPTQMGVEVESKASMQQKNYATVALCCLSVTNPFRSRVIQLVAINPIFDRCILGVIVVNCLFLAMSPEVAFVKDNEAIIDLTFLIIYTIEMVLKIIAMGFVMRQHSYLRDAWNDLDFTVVILGWAGVVLSAQNISAVRTIRIMRPLRTLNAMPGMSGLVSTIINSLPTMFDIFVLFCFMLAMFGTIATQLLMGRLEKRCMAKDYKGEMSHLLGEEAVEIICNTDAQCKKYEPNGVDSACLVYQNPMSNTFSFDSLPYSIMNIFQIITLEGWTDMMYLVREAEDGVGYDIFFIMVVLFGAYFVMNLMIAVQFTYLSDAFDEEDRVQEELREKQNLKRKQLEEDEEEDDEYYDDSEMDAEYQEKTDAANQGEGPNSPRAANGGKSADQSPRNDDDKDAQDARSPSGSGVQGSKGASAVRRGTTRRSKGCARACRPTKGCRDCRKAVVANYENNQKTVDLFVVFLIAANTVFLATEHYEQPEWLTRVQDIGNTVFTVLFGLEMFYMIFVLGLRQYLSQGFNVFDSIVVVISFVELFSVEENGGGLGLSVLRAFRLLRIFKIVKSWKELRVLLETVISSFAAIANLGVLLLLFLFIVALLMKQFYGENGPLYENDGSVSRYSFTTTAESLVTMFIILTGENWNQIMVLAIRQSGQTAATAAGFTVVILIGNYMIVNLFLAILLKFIAKTDDAAEKEAEAEEPADGEPKAADDKAPDQNAPEEFQEANEQDAPLNSSNSNIEEEFEQIKIQLRHLSNLNLAQMQRARGEAGDNAASINGAGAGLAYEGGRRANYEDADGREDGRDRRHRRAPAGNRYRDDFDNIQDQPRAQRDDSPDYGDEDDIRGPRSRARADSSAQKQPVINKNKKESSQKINSLQRPAQNGVATDAQQRQAGPTAAQIKQLSMRAHNPAAASKMSRLKAAAAHEIDPSSGNSLCIFSPENPVRVALFHLVESSHFSWWIMWLIGVNSLLLYLEQPVLVDPYQKSTISFMLTGISIIFIFEFVFKIIARGFIYGPKAYMNDSFNRLDFVLVVLSIAVWIIEANSEKKLSFVRGFRALRSLKPLRMINKNEGIKTVVDSLMKSIPSLLNVLLIIALFLAVFGILGVQLFKGSVSTCSDTSELITEKSQCVGYYLKPKTWNNEVIGHELAEREWLLPANHYDNIGASMVTFYEISTLEMWPDMMFNAIDGVGVDKVRKVNNSPAISAIYIIYIFVTTFFVMNLFISVIVDKFNDELKERQGQKDFTQEQKEWVKIQRLLVHTNPKIISVIPINCFSRHCFNIVVSSAFEYAIMAAIVINTGFLFVEHHNMSAETQQVLTIANITFVVIFTVEMILKIVAHGWSYYWHVNWNKFDFSIVVLSLLSLDERLLESLGFKVTALRFFRVSRLFRMVKTLEGLRSLLKTLYMSLGNILMTASLLLLFLFTFSIAGMSLFGKIEDGEFLNKDANFRTFYFAITTLWRACTGESWNGIMHECAKSEGASAYVFWFIFMMMTFFIFMNVFIAVIYESFHDIQASEDENDILSLKKKDIKAFQNTWATYNPLGEVYMLTMRLPDFLRELPPPLGYAGIRIEDSKLNKIIFCLNIRDHNGQVYYPEVMWAVFHSIVGINDERVNSCQQVKTILKIVRQKYKDLGKSVSLDSLCGNKYYRNDLTAIKYIQAMKILTKWRNFKKLQIQRKEGALLKQISNGQNAGPAPHSAPVRNKDALVSEADDKSESPREKQMDKEDSQQRIRNKRVEGLSKQAEERKRMQQQLDPSPEAYNKRGRINEDDSMSDDGNGEVTERNPMSKRENNDRTVVRNEYNTRKQLDGNRDEYLSMPKQNGAQQRQMNNSRNNDARAANRRNGAYGRDQDFEDEQEYGAEEDQQARKRSARFRNNRR